MQGAVEMGGMEHLLNVYATKAARHSIASFMGYSMVEAHEAGQGLTEGLWLVGFSVDHVLKRSSAHSNPMKLQIAPQQWSKGLSNEAS